MPYLLQHIKLTRCNGAGYLGFIAKKGAVERAQELMRTLDIAQVGNGFWHR
jgi:hypothetical protein